MGRHSKSRRPKDQCYNYDPLGYFVCLFVTGVSWLTFSVETVFDVSSESLLVEMLDKVIVGRNHIDVQCIYIYIYVHAQVIWCNIA